MKHLLQDATILITGASMGLGHAMALTFAPYHTNLILCARSLPLLHTLRSQCLALGANHVVVVGCDVTDMKQCEKVVQTGLSQCGVDHIDMLVLNAGVSGSIEFSHMTSDQVTTIFKTMMDINFMGYVNFTHLCLPYLQRKHVSCGQKPGVIAVISSMSGVIGVPYRTAYCASKFAVNGFFEVLRNELSMQEKKDSSVRPVQITVAQPGWIDTGLRDRHVIEAHQDQYKDTKKEGKVMTVEECIAAILQAITKGKREEKFILKQKMIPYLKAVWPEKVDRMIKDHITKGEKLQSKL